MNRKKSRKEMKERDRKYAKTYKNWKKDQKLAQQYLLQ